MKRYNKLAHYLRQAAASQLIQLSVNGMTQLSDSLADASKAVANAEANSAAIHEALHNHRSHFGSIHFDALLDDNKPLISNEHALKLKEQITIKYRDLKSMKTQQWRLYQAKS